MELEASIVERLQKLRQWQLDQQQRLLKHQQIQREILTQEQDCICKALELSLQELDVNESTLHVNNSNTVETNTEVDSKDIIEIHNESQEREDYTEMINNESCVSQSVNSFENTISRQSSQEELVEETDATDNHMKQQFKDKTMSNVKINGMLSCLKQEQEMEQFIMDGVTLLPSNKISVNRISIDDVPIPSLKKDFHTLLEEKLKDSENESSEKFNSNSTSKVKKPFLKKGEGLSRFKLNRESQVPAMKKRLRSASFSGNTQSESKYSKNKSRYNNVTQPLKNVQSTKSTHTNLSKKQLCLKDVPLPKKKIRSKSESNTSVMPLENYVTETKSTIDLNTSDFHSGTQREMEEVRIFELLEEKAENSSFCSTSSAVLALLQQSTPFKMKKKGYNTVNGMLNAKQTSPIIKSLLTQSASKCNQAVTYATSNKDSDSYHDFACFINQKSSQQDVTAGNKKDTNKRRHTPLKSQIQSMHTQQNSYNVANVENGNETDVSLHVRFSEYNEYKTIGLTDTSDISTESLIIKNFSDEKVWNDSLTIETSDTETVSIPYEVTQSPIMTEAKIRNNNIREGVNCERKSIGSTQQENNFNLHKDTDQYIYRNDESEYSDYSNQSLDDEHSVLYKYNEKDLASQKANASHNSKKAKTALERSNNKKVDHENEEKLREANETILKSELLKSRLLELEQEINIFRKENTALSAQRKKLQEDHRNLRKDYTEKEKMLEENIKQMEDRLQEERKKLAREKAALESRMRDSQEKAQQSKLERQEIQNLKQELEKLKDEMHIKESRWNAAQSRHKCQMRILKMENSKLKQEIERSQNLKKHNVRSKGKSGTSSNTKAIHQINRQLKQFNKESQKSNDNSLSDSDQRLIEPMMKASGLIDIENIEGNFNCSSNKGIINERLQKSQTSMVDVARKRHLYENLIREATSDLTKDEEHPQVPENLNMSKTDLSNKLKKINAAEDDPERSNKVFNVGQYNRTNSNNNVSLHVENDYEHFISPTKMSQENQSQKLTSISSDESSSNVHAKTTPSSCQSSSDIDKQGIKQIQHPDGRIEYWYPNGNVKKIFPDQALTKLIYYNGDVRETNKNGRVKYFYASTRTWHTTMPDGIEILEFANGQVERRLHNGTVEVSFPDGSIRILESDGSEKWSLPDGTVIQTFINGEKILTLPNGQREIHTSDHKRREYPDGTVKLIYPDGTQETRYSNGRIRLKDKDGNLLMDSHQ